MEIDKQNVETPALIDGLYTQIEKDAIEFLLESQGARKSNARALRGAKERMGGLFVRLAVKHADASIEVGKAPNGGISVSCAPLDADFARLAKVFGFAENGSKKPDSWNQYASNVRHGIHLGVVKQLAEVGNFTIWHLNKQLNIARKAAAEKEMEQTPLNAACLGLQRLIGEIAALDFPHTRGAIETMLVQRLDAVISAVREQMKKPVKEPVKPPRQTRAEAPAKTA